MSEPRPNVGLRRSVKVYDPKAVVMRGVHKDGMNLDFTAAQFDALRRGELPEGITLNLADFKKKDWSFSCPCCGDAVDASHVKTSKQGKATHWRIDDGFHNDPECDQYSPVVARLRQKGIKPKHRGIDNKVVVQLDSTIDPLGRQFDQADKVKKSRKRDSAARMSVRQLSELYFSLEPQERDDLEVRVGHDKRSFRSLFLHEPEDLLKAVQAQRKQGYIFSIMPDWDHAQPSGFSDDVMDVPGLIMFAHDQQANENVRIHLEMKVSSDIVGLFQSGRLQDNRELFAFVMPEYKFGKKKSEIVLSCDVQSLDDLMIGSKIRPHAGLKAGRGGTQALMDLRV